MLDALDRQLSSAESFFAGASAKVRVKRGTLDSEQLSLLEQLLSVYGMYLDREPPRDEPTVSETMGGKIVAAGRGGTNRIILCWCAGQFVPDKVCTMMAMSLYSAMLIPVRRSSAAVTFLSSVRCGGWPMRVPRVQRGNRVCLSP